MAFENYTGHARRRRHRVLPRRDDPAHACKSKSYSFARRILERQTACPALGRASTSCRLQNPQGHRWRDVESGLTIRFDKDHDAHAIIRRNPARRPRSGSCASANACVTRSPRSWRKATSTIRCSEGHLITVPEVRMSPDLKLATVYVMPLGGRDTELVLKALDQQQEVSARRSLAPRQPEVCARPALPRRRPLRRSGADREAAENARGATRSPARFGRKRMTMTPIPGAIGAPIEAADEPELVISVEPEQAPRGHNDPRQKAGGNGQAQRTASRAATSATCTAGSCSTSRSA